jgi:hypothetical protein
MATSSMRLQVSNSQNGEFMSRRTNTSIFLVIAAVVFISHFLLCAKFGIYEYNEAVNNRGNEGETACKA